MVTLVFAGIMTATIVSGFTPLNLLFARLSQRRTDKGLRRRPGLAAPPRPGGPREASSLDHSRRPGATQRSALAQRVA
jgi:hypothetical protein